MPNDTTLMLGLDGVSVVQVEPLEGGTRRVHLTTADEGARACPTCRVISVKPKGTGDPAELIISELVANATRHTPCHSIRLIVGRPGTARVRVGVVDRAPSRLPVLRPAGTDAESGRSLVLIDALADRWGCTLLGSHPTRGPWGKETWAELNAAP